MEEILPDNTGPVVSLAYQQSTGLLAVGQKGDEFGRPNLTLWDVETGRMHAVVESTKDEYVMAVAFADSGVLYYYTRDRGLIRYNDDDGQAVDTGWDVRGVTRVQPNVDDSLILTCGERIDVWDSQSDNRVWTLNEYLANGVTLDVVLDRDCWVEVERWADGFENLPALATFSDARDCLYVAGHNRDYIAAIDWMSGGAKEQFKCAPIQVASLAHCAELNAIGVIGRVPAGVFLWDTESRDRMLESIFNEEYVNTVEISFSASRKLAVVGTSVGYLNLHAMGDGRLLGSSQTHRGAIRCVVVDEGAGRLITAGDDGRVVLTNMDSLL